MITPSLRRSILAEWRGYGEPSASRPAVRVSDAIGDLVGKLGLGERICEQEILSTWQEIVGEFLATHSTPNRLVNGVLHVQVIQPSVRYELENRWRKVVLEKLKERFGAQVVRDIRFRI
jgi:predicted nucleic acid-binding Zn ribbon protein